MMIWSGDERDEGENADLEAEDGVELDDTLEAEEQLTLADEDEHLPWLEAEEDYEEPGFDSRLILFGLLGLVAVAAILFAAWYLLRDRPDSEMLADGSTIAAPDEPYKSRPDDAGGTDVSGTGDLSYGVGQGQTSEGQLASDTPAPSINRDQSGAASGDSGSESASTSGVGVQVGAYSTRASAQAGWNQLRGRFTALQGVEYRIVEGTADSGTIYRLQAVASNNDAADTMCRSIRNAGGDCQVKR